MMIPVAPLGYSRTDQQLMRDALKKDALEYVRFGRDIELARGERVILKSPNGSRFALVVDNAGVLSTVAA